MKKLRKAKYEVITVTIPTTAAPGQAIEASRVLDKDYAYCDGLAVSVEGTLSTMPFVNVGVRDSNLTLHDDVHIEQFQANGSVPPNEKYKDIHSPTDGRRMYARVVPPSAPAATVNIQFVFRLRDDLEVINDM